MKIITELICVKMQFSNYTPPNHTDLGKKLFSPSTWLHIMQCIVGILDHTVPEGTQAKLHHGPVVQNLEDSTKTTQIVRE